MPALSDSTLLQSWCALIQRVRDDVSFYATFPDLFTAAARCNWLRAVASLAELEAALRLPAQPPFDV